MIKVLVIDDDDLFRPIACLILKKGGMETIEAINGKTGFALARATIPDLILCDITMQGQDGLSLLSDFRNDSILRDIPFILMTGITDPETMREGMARGADDFLLKPFSAETLITAVKVRLGKHNALRHEALESKSRLVTILEATPDFIGIITVEGILRELNAAGRRMLGLNREESAGIMRMSDFCPDGPEGQSFESILKEATTRGIWRGETILRNLSGKEIFVSQIIVAHFAADGSVRYFSTIARDITDARKKQNELRLFGRTVEAAGNGIVIADATSTDLPIIYCNPAFERISGYLKEEVLGRDCCFLQGPGTDTNAVKLIQQSLAEERECRVVLKNYQKDGSLFWNDLRLSPVRNDQGRLTHFIAIHSDITAAKESEEKLRRSEELFRVITENAADLIAIVDKGGRRVYNSPSYQTLLGYSPEELKKTSALDQIHPEDREAVTVAANKTLSTGLGQVTEYRMSCKDGAWKSFEAHGAAIRSQAGEAEGLLLVCRDVTRRKKAEQERNLMEIQLRQAQKLESIGQLAAGIAHEINTPTQFIGDNARFLTDAFSEISRLLTELKGVLEAPVPREASSAALEGARNVLNKSDLDYLLKEIPLALSQSIDGVERVASIVGAMKDFSHPGAEKVPIDINHAIENTLTVARNTWKYIAVVQTQFEASLPLVPCLPGEFNQVILNLVVNAAQAISEALNGTTGRTGTITISTKLLGDHVEIRVSDTGKGIPEAIRDRIFEPFFTTKPVGQGTGQGLAIARAVIVDKHRGDIRFESRCGEGTTFIVDLPLSSE
ncbi:MAG: domain S-box protein [Verrucomicrobiales bacterium]|nr:domain S-box protein [Verrucomicrobiales bacterium]